MTTYPTVDSPSHVQQILHPRPVIDPPVNPPTYIGLCSSDSGRWAALIQGPMNPGQDGGPPPPRTPPTSGFMTRNFIVGSRGWGRLSAGGTPFASDS